MIALIATAVTVATPASEALASSETVGQAIVAAAEAIQSQSFPAQPFAAAAYLYCWDGGTTSGATSGTTDPHPDQGWYSNCNDVGNGRVGIQRLCAGILGRQLQVDELILKPPLIRR